MYNKNQLEFILYVFLNYKEVFNTVFDYIKSAFSDFKLHIKSSVVKYLLITYLLVLLIPIVSGSMIYVKSVNVAKRQAERIVEQINEETSRNISALLVECSNVYSSLLNDPVLKKMVSTADVDETMRYYAIDLKKTLNSFVQQKNVNGIVFDDIQIFFDNGFCINPERGEDLKGFLSAGEGMYFSDRKEVEDLIADKSHGKFIRNNSGFSYVNTMRHPGFNTDAVIVIHISDDEIYSDYEVMRDEGFKILLYNDNNELIFANDSNAEENIPVIEPGNKVHIDKKDYFVYEKDMNKIKMLCLMPVEYIDKDVFSLKILITFQIMLAVIAGIAAISFIMRKNKASIDDIMSLVGSGEGVGNEIDIIKNSILSSKENVYRLNRRIGYLEFLAVNDVIMNLVYGINTDKELMERVNMELSNKFCSVAVIDIADRGVFVKDGVFPDGQDPLFVAVSNVVGEILEGVGKVYVGIVLDEIIVLVNSPESVAEQLHIKFEEIRKLIYEHLEIKSRIAIGESPDGIKGISSLYYKAIGSVEKLRLSDETGVELSVLKNESNELEYEKHKLSFVNNIMSGDGDGAVKVLEDILLNGVNGNANISVIKYIVVDIMMNAITQLSKRDSSVVGDIMAGKRDILEEILSTRSFSAVKSRVTGLAQALSGAALVINESSDCIEEKVQKYIQDRYTDMNLSVKTIANDFSITYAYLSNRFKLKFGISMMDYIETLRITKAKELMQKFPTKSIDDISTECGYASKLTFSRQFKKHTSITPGKFRELNN